MGSKRTAIKMFRMEHPPAPEWWRFGPRLHGSDLPASIQSASAITSTRFPSIKAIPAGRKLESDSPVAPM